LLGNYFIDDEDVHVSHFKKLVS